MTSDDVVDAFATTVDVDTNNCGLAAAAFWQTGHLLHAHNIVESKPKQRLREESERLALRQRRAMQSSGATVTRVKLSNWLIASGAVCFLLLGGEEKRGVLSRTVAAVPRVTAMLRCSARGTHCNFSTALASDISVHALRHEASWSYGRRGWRLRRVAAPPAARARAQNAKLPGFKIRKSVCIMELLQQQSRQRRHAKIKWRSDFYSVFRVE